MTSIQDDFRCNRPFPTERTGLHVIICVETKRPFIDPPDSHVQSHRNVFSLLFRRFRQRAGLPDDKWFSDLRRTALSELGNTGATETEIVSISGHSHGSHILNRYVVPDKAAALATAQKRWKKPGTGTS